MVRCPRCGIEISKPTREWDYAAFHVKRFDCEKCQKSFKAYFHDNKLSHTIPKKR